MRRIATVKRSEEHPRYRPEAGLNRKDTGLKVGAVSVVRYFPHRSMFVKSEVAFPSPLPKMRIVTVLPAGTRYPHPRTDSQCHRAGNRLAGAAVMVRFFLPRAGYAKQRAVFPSLHRKMRINIVRDEAGARRLSPDTVTARLRLHL
jgi:hypothetical protein